jgi:hypothetical protein
VRLQRGDFRLKIWLLDYHPAYNTVNFENYEDGKNLREIFQDVSPLSGNWVRYNVILRDYEEAENKFNEWVESILLPYRKNR